MTIDRSRPFYTANARENGQRKLTQTDIGNSKNRGQQATADRRGMNGWILG